MILSQNEILTKMARHTALALTLAFWIDSYFVCGIYAAQASMGPWEGI